MVTGFDPLSYTKIVPRARILVTGERQVMMIRKVALLLLMSIPLAGAVTTATPVPVLAVMAGLILLALSVSGRVGQQQ